jgi:putative cell wall-binding protein
MKKRTKKALASLIIGMTLSTVPISVFAATTSGSAANRIAGADRIETAVKTAQAGWTTADIVIVAPAADANLVDALAAAPLAGAAKAPILLTDGSALDARTKQEIIALRASKVYAVGALKNQVVTEIEDLSGVTVEVLRGDNRIDTAAKIVAQLSAPAGTFVVGYDALADALSVASFAAANNYEILVTNPDGSLPASEVPAGKVYLIGGPALVKDIAGATRIAGIDRFETNQKVLNALSYNYCKVYVANGEQGHLVDALVGSSLAANDKAPIVLGDTVSVKAAADIRANLTADSQVIALGGTSIVPDAVLNLVKYIAPAKPTINSLKAINGKQLQIVFSQPIEKDTVVTDFGTLPDGIIIITHIPFDLYDNTTIDGNYMYSELCTDGLTLTLTAAEDSYFDGTYSVYIADGITNQGGGDLGEYTTIISSDDQTAPAVSSIVYNSATNQIDVNYSEPIDVDNSGNPSVTFNGKPNTEYVTVNPTKTKFSYDASKWIKGTTVNVTAAGGVDFLGNNQANITTQTVTIEMNESDLQVVSVIQKNSHTVRVAFDKTVAGKTALIATDMVKAGLSLLSNGKMVSDTDYLVTRNDDDDSTHRTFDITFTGSGPDYTTLYNNNMDSAQVYLSFGEGKIFDVFGNSNQQIIQTITMNKVTTPPVLVSAKLGSDFESFELRFDKSIISVDRNAVSVRKNGYGTSDFKAGLSRNSDKVVVVSYTGADNITNGTYTLYFDKDAITDINGNKTAAFNTTISVANSSNPATEITVRSVGPNKYEVSYSDEYGDPLKVSSSATTASSYTLNGDVLPSGTDIYFADSTKSGVIIALPSNAVNYNDANATLRNIRVYDDNGNKVEPRSLTVDVIDNVKPELLSASLSGNIMTLIFDDDIESTITTLKDLTRVLEIKGGSSAVLTGSANDPISIAIDGKKLILVLSGGSWSTVKAYSQITVKTLKTADDTHALLGDGTNGVSDGTIVTVSK